VNCGPRSYFLYIAITCLFYSHCLLYLQITTTFHSIRSFLCFKQTGKIDNLIISWEQSIWLCCVQVPHCRSQSKACARRPINCPELSRSWRASPSGVLSFSYWIDNLGFITERKLAAIFIKSSLGVSNWPVVLLHQQTQSSFLASLSPRHQVTPHFLFH
jgi:hypothetical protein